ncbi:hypothetical protein PBY51_022953 [Eleginops maclovinus]|uniref:Uncharacterized protein n=1 Tax=Eleginops maclovinus TaxID=56733 RepID=A0AAN8AIU0_ELEMC|nr:hypothetical protein PBY51_022953 [Eleginops maclovinus]
MRRDGRGAALAPPPSQIPSQGSVGLRVTNGDGIPVKRCGAAEILGPVRRQLPAVCAGPADSCLPLLTAASPCRQQPPPADSSLHSAGFSRAAHAHLFLRFSIPASQCRCSSCRCPPSSPGKWSECDGLSSSRCQPMPEDGIVLGCFRRSGSSSQGGAEGLFTGLSRLSN